MKKSTRSPKDKEKRTLSVSRATSAALDRIRAKRLEEGSARRQVGPGALVEEAVELLKRKEGL